MATINKYSFQELLNVEFTVPEFIQKHLDI